MILVDTRVRWERLKGAEAFMLTGTDEHGIKVQTAAEKAGVSTREFVDQVSRNFTELADTCSIDYDRFMRTTDKDHVDAVRAFWNTMMEKGYLYKGAHKGWYSVTDEAFYTDAQIVEVEGTDKKVSIETNSEVFYHEEENYFFRLSRFREPLLEHLKSNPTFVQPSSRHKELVQSLETEELADLSVSRPSSRLQWGIPVPNDASQTIYVWFDALINYLTTGGYPRLPKDTIWPADTHVVGKDIVRFHCIYWPIFLIAAGVELPKQVVVHTHWLNDGVKMSKSLGNVVDPLELVETYEVDPVRIFLMQNANLEHDCKFSESALQNYRNMLINKWANLISRCCGAKFNVDESVNAFRTGQFNNIELLIAKYALTLPAEVNSKREELVSEMNSLFEDMNSSMSDFRQPLALNLWWKLVETANGWFQFCQPWIYSSRVSELEADKTAAEETELVQKYIVFLTIEAMRVASLCLIPFMPELSNKALDVLQVGSERRSGQFAAFGADPDYAIGTNEVEDKIILKRRK